MNREDTIEELRDEKDFLISNLEKLGKEITDLRANYQEELELHAEKNQIIDQLTRQKAQLEHQLSRRDSDLYERETSNYVRHNGYPKEGPSPTKSSYLEVRNVTQARSRF